MAFDRSILERNRAATNRLRQMAGLSSTALQTPVGEHWTVAILLAHLALWDRRVLNVLAKTEQDGKLYRHQADADLNDYSLPIFAAIPPKDAFRLALDAAEELDRRLENFPQALLEEIAAYNPRWSDRSLHRNEHLDEAEQALRQAAQQG